MEVLLKALVFGLAITVLANLATTIYLHRSLSHRALSLRAPASFGFRFILWVTTGIRPRQWVAVHRKHHAFTDVAGDPHSPVLLGWRAVQVRNVSLYRASAQDPDTVARYAKDLPADKWDTRLFDRTFLGLAIGITISCVILGPLVGLLTAFVHLNLYLAGSAGVNAIGHHFGRKPYDNGAGNVQWLAFLTAGEGLHNNHHAAPTSARLAHRWYEVDYGWWVVCLLRGVGLATVRLDGTKLINRAVLTNKADR